MTSQDTLVINQLLGRLTYFHVLFIEPAMRTHRPRRPHHSCCRHRPGRTEYGPITTAELAGTPWWVLTELGHALGAPNCDGGAGVSDCCATCLVRRHSEQIVDCWIETEAHVYECVPTTTEQSIWGADISHRLASAFAHQHAINTTATCIPRGRSKRAITCGLALVAELGALWTQPLGQAPVISWLNHCTDLNDVARERNTRTELCTPSR